MSDDELIRAHIAGVPTAPARWSNRDRAQARLATSGVSVWVLVAHRRACGDDARVAADYELSAEEYAAAMAWYRANQDAVDALVLLDS
jgi:hypothetical protein